MAYCPNCEAIVSSRDRFCRWCGCNLGNRVLPMIDAPIAPPPGLGRVVRSPGNKLVPHGRCGGTGKIIEYGWTGQRERTCPQCDGDGSISIPYHWIRCKKCSGQGGELIRGMADPHRWVECDRCRGLGWKEPSTLHG